MDFDDWMMTKDTKYHPTDDTVALRRLRECWNDAQRYGGIAMIAVEDEMRDCKCEHWQVYVTCKPEMFDDAGNRIAFPPPPTKETLEAAGHRLALELECLLMDTKDLPTVSRWWASGMEALDEWQKLFPYNGPRLGV